MDAYESAYSLMSALVAAYSALLGRIHDDAAETERLEGALVATALEQQNLTAADTDRIEEITRTYPAIIDTIREREQ
ncbi:hypothetical protein [Streptomyces sp. NPDC001492]